MTAVLPEKPPTRTNKRPATIESYVRVWAWIPDAVGNLGWVPISKVMHNRTALKWVLMLNFDPADVEFREEAPPEDLM